MTSSLEQLEEIARSLSVYGDILALLHWDTGTMLPAGSIESRGEQIAQLEGYMHSLVVSERFSELLSEAEQAPPEDEWRRANLRELRRLYTNASCLPQELVEAKARAVGACEMRWRQARKDNDFAGLLPALEEVMGLVRETANARAAASGLDPFDALMDEFEPGARAEWIDPIFDDLRTFIPEVLPSILERQRRSTPRLPIKGHFPVESQKALGRRVMKALGFDFNRGRLDVSVHPFCGGTPDDIRITTRYSTAEILSSLMGIIHETGHGQYEAGLPKEWRYQPVGRARGMALHESQSLLLEMQASRSRDFITWLRPLIIESFGELEGAFAIDNIVRHVQWVERGLIRVDADEVTYPLHVILRYDLERSLLSGDLQLKDLPSAWADGMSSMLGLTPPTDASGCMQDVHWPSGAFGYFPSYTLGALSAAQIFQAANKAEPSIPEQLQAGSVEALMGWLRTNIHGKASVASTQEILEAATGSGLSTAAYKAHVQRRYVEGADLG